MSYILDALRKADAQRESDPARGIHAQPLGGPPSVASRGAHRPWLWGSAALGLVAVAFAGWYVYRERAPAQNAAPVRVAARPAPAGVAVVSSAAAPVVSTLAPGAAVPEQPASAIEPPAPQPAQAGVPPPEPAPRPASQATARGIAQTPPTAPGAGAGAPAAPAQQQAPGAAAQPPAGALPGLTAVPTMPTTPTTPTAATPTAPVPLPRPAPAAASPPPAPPTQIPGMPADAPKLAISGGVYSANPAHRMLIVNGQVFNEGSEIGPGVVLEEVRAKTALVRFRGSRYSVSF